MDNQDLDEFTPFILEERNSIIYYDAEQILLYLENQFMLLLKQRKIELLESPFDSCWGYACEEFFDNIGGQGRQGVEFVFPSYNPQDHD